ncbi:hypothetical protein [Kitasatospora sp. NPDC097643]|uniref:hypothetical protein n=1 Tax=Kitasatospora sp. NPDC097643 TaxID=3157230 RepID=UPI0033206E60
MYEPVVDAWKRYAALLHRYDATHRVPLGVIAEVHTRFGQLDLLMDSILSVLDASSWPPAGPGQTAAAEHRRYLKAWDWASVYTDAFYFFGWRTTDLLNGTVGGPFPYLEPVQPLGLLSVRGTLHAHPERQADYYRHGLELRDEALEKVVRAADALELAGGDDDTGTGGR